MCCVVDLKSDVDVEAGSEVDAEVAEGAETSTEGAEADLETGAGAGAEAGTEGAEADLEAGAGAGADADSAAGEILLSAYLATFILPSWGNSASSLRRGNGLGLREGRTACCFFSNLFFSVVRIVCT